MRKFGFLGVAGLLTLALAGCHSGGQGGAAGGGGATGSGQVLKIAVIPKGTSHEYWKSIHAGALKAQQDLAAKGTKINVIWQGTESEGDRNGQVSLVETFVTQHVAGIVLAPVDNQALVTPVHEAKENHIPVVIIDSALNGDDYVSFCATPNEKGGQLAGQQLGQLMGSKGNVIVLPYAQGSASTEDREKGFAEAIAKFPGIKVLSDNQYGGPTSDTAYKTASNLLTRYGTQVNGVFASNETNTRGMLGALKDKNLLSKVKFVGFDAAPDLVTALQGGQLQGLVVQDPFKMGDLGVTTVVDAIQGKSVPKTVDTGVYLITPANVNNPDMQSILHPPLNQYLK